MFRPRVIPCLLLKDKGLVKTIKFKDPTYVGDPINAVKLFNDFEADELVFLDIMASKEYRTPPLELVKKIGNEAFMPFAVGGGIKTVEEMRQIIQAGAEKVVLNTHAIENPVLVEQGQKVFGNQAIVVSLDAKKTDGGAYEIYTRNGSKATGLNAVHTAQKMESLGAGEILINSIDRDGTRDGYDIELIKQISQSVEIPVVAMGGADALVDLSDAVNEGGASAVAAGSMFVFVGRKRAVLINYPEKSELEGIFH